MVTAANTFQTSEPFLHELIENIHKGIIQLPDFQRGWIWDDEHIRALIASVSLSYPIGAVMLMQTGSDGIRFKPRLVEGVRLDHPPEPSQLILDGQQRLTSLYLALRSGQPVLTRSDKGQDIQRVYYLDMKACADPNTDRIDAVLSLPPERILTRDFGRAVELDVSNPQHEYRIEFFPIELLFDPRRFLQWKLGYGQFHRHEPERMLFLGEFESRVILRFQTYKVPVIELLRGTPKEAVCQVFEKVNTGGVTLSVFELVTATFAAEDFSLRDDWNTRHECILEHEVLHGIDSTDFLTAVTLLASYHHHCQSGSPVSCKRRDVLKLSLADYRQYVDLLQQGMFSAARLLARVCIFDVRTLPYKTQLVPLSVVCALLRDDFDKEAIKQKLLRWYWCGTLGELYGSATESRFAFDVVEIMRWLTDGSEPRTVQDANFSPLRLLSLQTRNSAAYKGIMALLMLEGSYDFLSGDPLQLATYFDLAVDIHHIFPKAYCESRDISFTRWNSVINKAVLSARTNRMIGGRAPSVYLNTLQKSHGLSEGKLQEILKSHRIDSTYLYADDFDGFFIHRATQLLSLIESAMGKTITGRDSEEVIAAFGKPLYQESVP